MSGSSVAQHAFSRCVVVLDAGISISWEPDPDGSIEHGQQHHQREEAGFHARLERATADIEVLFDGLEAAGHTFIAPSEPGFEDVQRGTSGEIEICRVLLACSPALSQPALDALAQSVAGLVAARPEPVTPVAEPAPPEPPTRQPWWRLW